MRNAVNRFQKSLFILLLLGSTFSGFLADFTLSGNRTILYVAFDAVMIFLAITSLAYLRGRIILIVLFIIACIAVNLTYSSNNLMYSLNGIREILILVAITIFYYKIFGEENEDVAEEYIEVMKKFSVFFLLAQLPVAFLQFHEHGASDFVGGTFGNKGSGILTLSVLCTVYFLSNFVRSNTQRVLLYFCLLPLLLNETKLSFILIPALILFIHFQPKLKNIVGGVLAAGFFLYIFNMYYSDQGSNFENNLTGIFSKDFLDSYLFGDIYSSEDVPRFTKIVVGWHLASEAPRTLMFGIEYGIFKGGNVVEASQFATSIQWLMSGTRPYIFFLMLQGGLMLIAGLFWMLFHINNYFVKNNNKFKSYLFIVFLIILFYNDALRNQGFVLIYFFTVFYANSNLYNRNLITT
ncbi:MAG TPA: hypothetical protein VM101_00890 [Flavitalea sp.]|nr:hypothetical protein [Flavitalea sp.]